MPSTADVAASLDAAWNMLNAQAPVELEVLPAGLAAVVAVVLGADGASVSLLSFDLRVPLGASDSEASTAERLQFTLGEGPCLGALTKAAAVAYDLQQMTRVWPLFARGLVSDTSYRSVASVPLPMREDGRGGAVDLYHHAPAGALGFDLDATTIAADWVVARLVGAQPPTSLAGADDASKVPWLQATGTRRRIEVWVAIGAVSKQLDLDTAAALTVIRTWAQQHDTDLDAVAANIVTGQLHPQQLQP